MKEHSLRWRCTSKSHGEFLATSRDDYISHMKSQHVGKLTDAQLGVLADRNGRMPGPLFKACPLCGVEAIEGSIESHIVGHLRLLALKSLPSFVEAGEEGQEQGSRPDSLAESTVRTRSTIKEFFNGGDEASESSEEVYLDQTTPDDPTFNRNTNSPDEWVFMPTSTSIESPHPDPLDDPILAAFINVQVNTDSRREKRIIFDPDCAICHAPAEEMACECEATVLELYLRQAVERVMGPIYSDIRSWVYAHAGDWVLHSYNSAIIDLNKDAAGPSRFVDEANERKGNGKQSNSDGVVPRDPGTEPKGAFQQTADRHAAGRELQQKIINQVWEEAVMLYPPTLEYFYSLVELTLPDDNHPAVKDPPLSAFRGSRKAARRGSSTTTDAD